MDFQEDEHPHIDQYPPEFHHNILKAINRPLDISSQGFSLHTNENHNVSTSHNESDLQDTRRRRRFSRRLKERELQKVCEDRLGTSFTFASPNGITLDPPTAIDTPNTSRAYPNHVCESPSLSSRVELCNISKSEVEKRRDDFVESRLICSDSCFNNSVTPRTEATSSKSKLFRLENETIDGSDHVMTVLVDDTPVHDYGLRVGMRRKRHLLPKAAWNRLLQDT